MMNNIAIIPARSGSKGLIDKNIKELNGKPLIQYSIEAAKKTDLFSRVIVSTDSEKYSEISRKIGAEVPFLRSELTSSDNASSWDVVREVLNMMKEKYDERYDTVCLLQPTSPLRTSEDIIRSYELFALKNADAVTSVCEVDHSPLWTMTLDDSLSLKEYRKRSQDIPRQKIQQYYRVNGAIYIRKIDYTQEHLLLDNDEYAYIMSKQTSVDIDDKYDFAIAGVMLGIKDKC